MKFLEHIRSFAGECFVGHEEVSGTTTGDGHVHSNLPLLERLREGGNGKYLKIDNKPTETHLLVEEW